MKLNSILAAALLGVAAAGSAFADSIPYAPVGTQNTAVYSFTAASTGDISAYFLGSGAAYSETLGLLVNGVDSGVNGLENHTTPIGTQLDFGDVVKGDVLTFYINVATTGDTWYSNTALNTDGVNHVYSTAYTGAQAPAGTYVAFEDQKGGGDLNYHDETFVFSNVATTVPEPANLALLLGGLGVMGFLARRRRSH